MHVLLDEQLPRHLARYLHGHEIRTVQQQVGREEEWRATVCCCRRRFEVFVTADRNLEYQQNLSKARLGVVLLVASSNALEDDSARPKTTHRDYE